MSNSFQATPGRRGTARLGLLLLAGLPLAWPGTPRAHDVLGVCVQHAVCLTVGARHIDVTLDLTFFEQWSASERAAMDTNGDGVVTRPEQEAYSRRIGTNACRQVKLFVAGRELSLAPLYDPELDLLGNSRVGPAHHRLRLFFFAATPTDLRAGDRIVIEDRLWPSAETLATTRAEGRDGCRLEAGSPMNARLLADKPDQARRLTFKCLQPPATKPPAHSEFRRGAGPTLAEPHAGSEPPPCTRLTTRRHLVAADVSRRILSAETIAPTDVGGYASMNGQSRVSTASSNRSAL